MTLSHERASIKYIELQFPGVKKFQNKMSPFNIQARGFHSVRSKLSNKKNCISRKKDNTIAEKALLIGLNVVSSGVQLG